MANQWGLGGAGRQWQNSRAGSLNLAKKPQQLKLYTSLWAMMPHDQTGVILPYEQICEMVADAGYDGMAIDLGAGDVARRIDAAV